VPARRRVAPRSHEPADLVQRDRQRRKIHLSVIDISSNAEELGPTLALQPMMPSIRQK
jgi:hypothetical protein